VVKEMHILERHVAIIEMKGTNLTIVEEVINSVGRATCVAEKISQHGLLFAALIAANACLEDEPRVYVINDKLR
jgi:predicted regulator of amino acid metabolism with ACT domain